MTHLDGDGKFGESFEAMRRHLRYSKSRRSLVGAINDPSALGALRAFQEAGRTDSCAIMGPERVARRAAPSCASRARAWSDRSRNFPEKYGAEIVAVALDILHRRAVPPAVFVKHQLVTPETVNHIYPNDELMMTRASPPESHHAGWLARSVRLQPDRDGRF